MPTKNPYRTTYGVAGCKFKMTLSTNSDKDPGPTIPRQGNRFPGNPTAWLPVDWLSHWVDITMPPEGRVCTP